jgi:hypothetical protein
LVYGKPAAELPLSSSASYITSSGVDTGEGDMQADGGSQGICLSSSVTLGHFPSVEIFDQPKADVR